MAYLNGRLPTSALTAAVIGGRLRADAAESVARLARDFRARFGYQLRATDTYRDYEAQVAVKAAKGSYAATPGTSNHGWGLAVDFASNINKDTSAEHRWMETNGPRYGWINPAWASNRDPRDGQYEPWHWEYRPELDTKPGGGGGAFAPAGGGPSAEVITVQQRLRVHGYPVTVDGVTGPQTTAAVTDFQTRYGLTPDGIAGPATMSRLQEDPMTPEQDALLRQIADRVRPITRGSQSTEIRQELANLTAPVAEIQAHVRPITRGGQPVEIRQELANVRTEQIRQAAVLDRIAALLDQKETP